MRWEESTDTWFESTQEQREARLVELGRRALPLFGPEATSCRVSTVRIGENAVFRLDDPRGVPLYALRVHRPGYNSDMAIRSELSWMAALRDAGIPTPTAVTGIDGEFVQVVEAPRVSEARRCLLFKWIRGAPLDSDLPGSFELLGERIGMIHDHGRAWRPPPGFERHRWDLDGMLGHTPIWGSFTELRDPPPGLFPLLHETRDVVANQLERFGTDSDRFGLIHADPNPTNILIQAERPFVLDFDDCGFGWRLYDVAVALYEYLGDDDIYASVRASFVRGYRSAAPLPDDHLQMLPVFLATRILVILGWTATRSETPRARDRKAARIALAFRFLPGFLRQWGDA